MNPREAWIAVTILTIVLLAALATAGAVSEQAAPTNIGSAWSQEPK